MKKSLSTAIHNAARNDDALTLRSLLDENPDAVEIENEHGEAALVTAAVAGSTVCVRLLLDRGAEPGRQKGFALTCACYHGHTRVVQAILRAGGDDIVRQVPRWHGLHAACGWGDSSKPNAEIVKMLLDCGASSKRVFEGRTPLQYAIDAGRHDIVSILTQHGKSRS